jgi:peptidoglycan/LPS O-acetylase OafA/YrhL
LRWSAAAAVVGLPSLLIVAGIVRTHEESWLRSYRGGYTVAALVSSILILWALEGRSALLTSAPLRAVGVRAYSLYLWHFPVLITARRIDIMNDGFWTTTVAIAGGIAAAEVSYRWIEMPFRRGNLRRRSQPVLVPGSA